MKKEGTTTTTKKTTTTHSIKKSRFGRPPRYNNFNQ